MSRVIGTVILTIMGVVFTLVAYPIYNQDARESKTWPHTEGVITKSEVTSRRSSGERKYRFHVVYSYKVDGESLQNNDVSMGKGGIESTSSLMFTDDLSEFPVGKKVKVYYKPGEPSTSCLKPGVVVQSVMLLGAGLLWLALSIFIIIYSLKKKFLKA